MTWADYIRKDMQAHIAAGKAPSPLTLHSLAKHYGVSISPVRMAIDQLLASGVLRRQGPRRLIADPAKAAALAEEPPAHPPRDVFQIVSDELMRQSLRGEAVYLREVQTAERFGISGTQVRQILSRLAGAGLIEHVPRQGWRLRPFRQEDMAAFIQVRESLELLALDLARPRLVREDLQDMYDANILRPDPQPDDRLHTYIQQKAGNPYVDDFFARHGAYYRILGAWESQDRDARMEAAQQHRGILKAMIDSDWELARKRLSHHIRDNYPILRKLKLLPKSAR